MKSSAQRQSILLASIGSSPGVLTSVVGAFAHQRVPVVPDEIVVFITKNGKTLLKKEQFDNGVWADILKSLAREGIDSGMLIVNLMALLVSK